MSETPTSTEPTTGPIEAAQPQAIAPTPPPPPPYVQERKPSRLNAVAAWVGIVAGTVFVVAVIFFSGFILGAHSGGGHHGGGGPGGHRGGGQMHEDGRPMGPMFRPGPGFIFPGGPGGFPGFGPGAEPGGPGAPGQPGAPTPPGR